jgi:uncharacterized membrane protein
MPVSVSHSFPHSFAPVKYVYASLKVRYLAFQFLNSPVQSLGVERVAKGQPPDAILQYP